MSNSFTGTPTAGARPKGWLANIIASFVAAGVGGLICLFTLVVIWVGEGRTNMATLAEGSLPAPLTRIDSANAGRLVSVTGPIEAAPLSDGQFLAPGPYLYLERRVEMFAWVEHERTRRRETASGTTISDTTYSYSQQWTSTPASGEGFHRSEGHRNPPLPFQRVELSAERGRVGAYDLNLATLDLPPADDLALTAAMVRPDDRWRLEERYVFVGAGSLEQPRLGDLRVSYVAVPAGLEATVFGEQHTAGLVTHRTPAGDEFYRALPYDRAEALRYLSIEDTIIDWVLRPVSLLMLWLGMALVFAPLNAIIGLVPALRQANGCLASLLSFVPAFAVWGVAELVASMAPNLWLLIGAVVLVLVLALGAGRLLPIRRAPATVQAVR